MQRMYAIFSTAGGAAARNVEGEGYGRIAHGIIDGTAMLEFALEATVSASLSCPEWLAEFGIPERIPVMQMVWRGQGIGIGEEAVAIGKS